uniref:Bestrophin homolog n=1 Tax=Meloidogyne floridensis TaxID=298350 RepID=A0A915NSN6_9BILA
MAIYVTLLDEKSKNNFAHLAQYTGITADYIPLTFMLGFFVKIVVERFVDSVAHAVCSVVRGNVLKTIKTRRNIMRYLCLMQVLVLRDISVRVRKRFPTMQALISAGLLEKHEQNLIEEIGYQYNEQFGIYWLPYNWICQLCYRLRENGNIASDPLLSFVLRELREYRERLQTLINFDLVPIPLEKK